MGKPADELTAENDTARKAVLELPKAEGVFNVTFTDGTKGQFFYNPVTGHWLAAADGKCASPTQQVGYADRIAGAGGEALERTIASIEPIVANEEATV